MQISDLGLKTLKFGEGPKYCILTHQLLAYPEVMDTHVHGHAQGA